MNEPNTTAQTSGYVHLTADERKIFTAICNMIWERTQQVPTPQSDGYNYIAQFSATVKLNGTGWAAINSLIKKL